MYRNFAIFSLISHFCLVGAVCLIFQVSVLHGSNLNSQPTNVPKLTKNEPKFAKEAIAPISTPTFGWLSWTAYESPHYLIYAPPGFEEKAWRLLQEIEKHTPLIESFTGPIRKTTLVIDEFGSVSNGYANPISNKMSLGDYPPGSVGFVAYESWLLLVGIHEVAHIGQLTQTNDNIFQWAFGPLFSPNVGVPTWFAEGLAVSVESAFDPNQGRLNHPRAKTLSYHLLSSGVIDSVSDLTFTMDYYPRWEIPYMLGARFIDYVIDTYGKKAMVDLIYKLTGRPMDDPFKWMVGMVLPLARMDDIATQVYGKTWAELFDDWKAYELAKPPVESGQVLVSTPRRKNWVLPTGDASFIYGQEALLKSDIYSTSRVFRIKTFDVDTSVDEEIYVLPTSLTTPPVIVNDTAFLGLSDQKSGFHNTALNGYGATTTIVKIPMKGPEKGSQNVIFTKDCRAFMVTTYDPSNKHQPLTLIYAKDNHTHEQSELWQYQQGRGHKKLGNLPFLVAEMLDFGDAWVVVAKATDRLWDIYKVNPQTLAYENLTNTPYPEGYVSKVSSNRFLYAATVEGKTNAFQYDLLSGNANQITDVDYVMYPAMVGDSLIYMRPGSTGTDIIMEPSNGILNQAISITTQDKHVSEAPMPSKPMPIKPVPIKTVNATVTNLQSMVMPWVRVFPIPLLGYGGDHLETTQYLARATTTGPAFQIGYVGIVPFQLTGSIESDWAFENVTTELVGAMPLYRSGLAGLQSIEAFLYHQAMTLDPERTISGDDVFNAFGPGVSVGYWDGNHRAMVTLRQRVQNGGYGGTLSYKWKGTDHGVTVDIYKFENMLESHMFKGEFSKETYRSGLKLDVSVQKKLASLNKTFTVPWVALGDVYGVGFVNYMPELEGLYELPESYEQSYYTMGVGLQLATYSTVFRNLSILYEAGAYAEKHGSWGPYISVLMSMPF